MKVEIEKKQRVYDGFFKIDEAILRHEKYDGEMSETVSRLCFERGDGVAAIVYNTDSQKAILTEQFRYATYEKGPGWIMEVAAGMLEEGEVPEAALRRELIEELGYIAETLEHIATFYVSPGGTSERIFLYGAKVNNAGKVESGGGLEDEHEDIKILEFSIEELKTLMLEGEIQDAKTIIAVNWLQGNYESV